MATNQKIVDLQTLTYYDTKLKAWVEGSFKLVEADTAEEGYLKTYKLQVNGVDVANSAKINIPKDFMLKDAEVKTCTVADEPIAGLSVGDKYFDFTINVADSSATAKHVYLAAADLITEYTAGDGITITNDAIAVKTGDGLQINGTSKALEAKLGTGLEINSTSKAIDLVAQDATSASDANAPDIGGITKADYVGFKGAINSLSAGTETAPTADANKNETVVTKTHTIKGTTVGNNTAADLVTTTEYYVTYGLATATTTSGNYKGTTNTMPEASADNEDDVYLFTGTTTGEFTNGTYYISTETSGTYSWEEDTSAAAGKAGLLSNADKDAIDAVIATFGESVELADNNDIDALFSNP